MLFRTRQLPMSSAELYHTVSTALHTAVFPPFNLHRARVRRNHGRLPSDGLIERAQNSVSTFHCLPKTRVRLSTSVTRDESHPSDGTL